MAKSKLRRINKKNPKRNRRKTALRPHVGIIFQYDDKFIMTILRSYKREIEKQIKENESEQKKAKYPGDKAGHGIANITHSISLMVLGEIFQKIKKAKQELRKKAIKQEKKNRLKNYALAC